MVVELIYKETLGILQNEEAKQYLDSALDVINFMEKNNLDDINSCGRYYMALDFSKHITYHVLYGENNHCRALHSCIGRLPSAGDVRCYFSKNGRNIEITLLDSDNDIYFSLDLYTSTLNFARTGVTFNTEKRK